MLSYISCENFVKFGPVTQELTNELICECQVRHGQKKLAHLVEYLRRGLAKNTQTLSGLN